MRQDIHGMSHGTPGAALQTLVALKDILTCLLLDPARECVIGHYEMLVLGFLLRHAPPIQPGL
jgi:hypothetical protein